MLTERKHVPVRTCVVCGRKRSKFALLRLALDAEKLVVVDSHQSKGGRGAYACPDCLPRLRLTKRVQKAFRNQAARIARNILQQPSILQNDGTSGDSEERRSRCDIQSIAQLRGKF